MLIIRIRTKVLDYVLVLKIAQEVNFVLESGKHTLLPLIQGAITVRGRNFDLFDCHEFTSDCMEGKIDTAERTLADKGTLHPFDIVPRTD